MAANPFDLTKQKAQTRSLENAPNEIKGRLEDELRFGYKMKKRQAAGENPQKMQNDFRDAQMEFAPKNQQDKMQDQYRLQDKIRNMAMSGASQQKLQNTANVGVEKIQQRYPVQNPPGLINKARR